jgi:hypothetical protein
MWKVIRCDWAYTPQGEQLDVGSGWKKMKQMLDLMRSTNIEEGRIDGFCRRNCSVSLKHE